MEESRAIELKLGTISWESTLGSYYIDLRPAKIHYSKAYYDTQFDNNGVPFFGSAQEAFYSPVNVAQYGFMLHDQYLETNNQQTFDELKACCNILEEKSTLTAKGRAWYYTIADEKYHLEPPFASAMAQGEIMSLFLRFYQLTNEQKWLILAQEAFQFLLVPVSEGGVCIYESNGEVWLEEFPSTPASKVLNGFVYALLGIVDLYRVTKDEQAKNTIDQCFITLRNNIHLYDCGYWSYYDLLKKELVRYYYQKNVHVPQLLILHQLTQEGVYLKLATKWRKTIHPLNFIFVQIMYRVLPRWRKLFK